MIKSCASLTSNRNSFIGGDDSRVFEIAHMNAHLSHGSQQAKECVGWYKWVREDNIHSVVACVHKCMKSSGSCHCLKYSEEQQSCFLYFVKKASTTTPVSVAIERTTATTMFRPAGEKSFIAGEEIFDN